MKNYLKYFRTHIIGIIGILLLSLIILGANFAEPQLNSQLLVLISASELQTAIYIILAILVVGILKSIVSLLNEKLKSKIILSISNKILYDLAGIISNSTSKSLLAIGSEKVVAKLAESQNFVQSIFNLLSYIFTILTGLIMAGYMASISLSVFGLSMLVILIILFLEKNYYQNQVTKKLQASEKSENFKKFMLEICDGFLDIKAQNMSSNFKEKLKSNLGDIYNTNQKVSNANQKNNCLITIIQTIYRVLLLLLEIFLLSQKQISVENVVILFMYSNYVSNLAFAILATSGELAGAKTSAIRMNELFQFEILEKDKFGTQYLKEINGDLSINHVTVNIEDKNILNNVSASIPKNSFVGIVGNSGCGKSTLLKVLAHEILPDEGSVTIDGVDINKLDNYSLHRAIRLAPQFAYFFHLSIRDNLRLVHSDASDKEIWHALNLTDASEFVKNLGGLDTLISNNSLSGGQKQKLALARIALRKSKILLLDEATSALDNISQANILGIIHKAKEYHSIIMVAHRMSTIKDADLLIFMENGEIIATGTYQQLYTSSEKFRRLADSE